MITDDYISTMKTIGHPLRLLMIGHDAELAGAQRVLLDTITWMTRNSDCEIHLILLGAGPLLLDYARLVPLLMLNREAPIKWNELVSFCPAADIVYGNSVVSPACYPSLIPYQVPMITHIHELEQSIRRYSSPAILEQMYRYTRHYLVDSRPVFDNLVTNHSIDFNNISVITPFIFAEEQPQDRLGLRRKLGLSETAFIVMGCGTRDWRKGADIFVETARVMRNDHPEADMIFLWAGEGKDDIISDPCTMVKQYSLEGSVKHLANQPLKQLREYFETATVFYLSSREDPFPLVALEATRSGLPIVCYEDTGGVPYQMQKISENIGFVLPYENINLTVSTLFRLYSDRVLCRKLEDAARKYFFSYHSCRVGISQMLNIFMRYALNY